MHIKVRTRKRNCQPVRTEVCARTRPKARRPPIAPGRVPVMHKLILNASSRLWKVRSILHMRHHILIHALGVPEREVVYHSCVVSLGVVSSKYTIQQHRIPHRFADSKENAQSQETAVTLRIHEGERSHAPEAKRQEEAVRIIKLSGA